MAATLLRNENGISVYGGLSTDTFPTTGQPGSLAFYSDNDSIARWDGNSWVYISTGGAAQVNVTGGMDARGNYPTTWYLDSSATVAASATDNVVIYTSGDVSFYNCHMIENFAEITDTRCC